MKRVPFKVVDVFTDAAFSGNPAGVVWEDQDLTGEEMQKIAAEINLSETAFVTKPTGPANLGVRFFTPKQELELAGHPTIAVFHVLAEEAKFMLREPVTTLIQETKAGTLPVELQIRGGLVKKISMAQLDPSYKPFKDSLEGLAKTLGVEPGEIATTGLPVEIVSTGLSHLIVPVNQLKTLKSLEPNLQALGRLNKALKVNTTHLFTLETISHLSMAHARDFGPAVGILEDPATGSANGALGAYLLKNHVIRGNSPLTIVVEQGYVLGRPSEINVEVHFDNYQVTMVKVGGKAVTVIEGEVIL